MKAVMDLVDANGKEKEGAFQMMFDQRDQELEKLEMEDLTSSMVNVYETSDNHK